MMYTSNSWPLLLDLSKDDSKRVLRNLELEAYGSLVSAFRAQGDLSKQKKKILQEIQHVLSISTERHRAEIRRAVNDEKLATVADSIAGPDISSEWHVEGRRLVPIMPRLVPQTAFTLTADNIANQQVTKNINLAKPQNTAHKDTTGTAAPLPAPNSHSSMMLTHATSMTHAASLTHAATHSSNRVPRPVSPTPSSNVLVLPSGMAIHIKEESSVVSEEETQAKRRRRSSSAESLTLVRPPVVSMIPTLPPTTSRVPIRAATPPAPLPSSPVKFSTAKSPPRHHSITTTPSGQKVIIVSSSMAGSTTSTPATSNQTGSYVQRAVCTIPGIKSPMTTAVTTTVNTMMYPRSSVMMAAEQAGGRSNVITIAATAASQGISSSGMTPVYQQAQPTAGVMTPRPRVRTITARPRVPYHAARATAVSMSNQQVVTPSNQSIHIRPALSKPTIHIKQEGSMKIITQSTPSTAGRILPKPSGSQVLMVTTTASAITMVTKTANAGAGCHGHIQGSKVLNISTSGGRILATSTPRTSGANVVTVNPKTLQLTTVKGPAGTTVGRIANPTGINKPNVIVVQKAQPKKSNMASSSTPTVQVARTSTSMASPFEKELVSFLQRQGPSLKESPQQRSILDRKIGRPVIGEGQTRRHVVVRQKSADGNRVRSVTLPSGSKSSILAGLIQAVGISPDNIAGLEHAGIVTEDSRAVASITSDDEGNSTLHQNQWVEYDVHREGATYITPDTVTKIVTSESTDASAIKALLDLQAGSSGTGTTRVIGPRPSTLELSSIHGEDIMLEPIQGDEDPGSPEIQIIGTSGLDDTPPSHQPHTSIRHRPNIQRLQKVRVVDDSGNSVQVQISNPEELNQLAAMASKAAGQQLVGEIDPHTGALYTAGRIEPSELSQMSDDVAIQVISSEDHEAEQQQAALLSNQGATKTIILSTSSGGGSPSVTAQSTTTVIDTNTLSLIDSTPPASATEKIDFLSSALNQAQIDLNSYQYVEESSGKEVAPSSDGRESQPTTLVSILNRPSAAVYTPETKVLIGSPQHVEHQVISSKDNLPDLLVSTPASAHVAMGNRLVTKVTSIPGRASHMARSRAQFIPVHEMEKKGVSTIHVIKAGSSNINSQSINAALCNVSSLSVGSSVSVASEPGNLDPGHMKFEDLSSQQNMDSDLSSEDILVTSGYSDGLLDSSANVRLSKRKRKAPLTSDEISSPTQGGWIRVAIGILQRVMRVRGSYKEKGEMNAASWFTQPVDAREVPDYYEVIQNPMDFATIKKKFELGQYVDIEDFHVDMLLVRDNCHRYNPPGTDVRRDCDEVFNFYAQEYDKALARWQQGFVSSPSGKRPRIEHSPIHQ